jgi:hypothetical protein
VTSPATISDFLQISGIILGIIGLSGLITAGQLALRGVSRTHGFLRLRGNADEAIDIVISEAEHGEGGVGFTYPRTTTPVGNLKAATQLAQAGGQAARRRPIIVAVSQEVESTLTGDLLVLGMPGKNQVADLIVEHLQRCHPEMGLDIQQGPPAKAAAIELCGHKDTYEPTRQPGVDIPDHDFALIVMWVNPTSTRKRRLILCAGFTAYGTEAAARYLVDDLMGHRYRKLRKARPGLASVYSLRRWPCFAMVVKIVLMNGQAVDVIQRAFAVLPDPGRPPIPDGKDTRKPAPEQDVAVGELSVAEAHTDQ